MGWLLRNVLVAVGATELSSMLPADHYLSLYGVMAEWLPGYGLMRYPAKWSTLLVACCVLLAARQLHRMKPSEWLANSRIERAIAGLSGLMVLILLTLFFVSQLRDGVTDTLGAVVGTFLRRAPREAWIGEVDRAGVLIQWIWAFAIPVAVFATRFLVRRRHQELSQTPAKSLPLPTIAAWIVLLEMFVTASLWCSFAATPAAEPTGPWSMPIVWADSSEANILSDGWISSQSNGPSEQVDYQRAFLLGKLGLLEQKRNLASTLSIEPELCRRLRVGLMRLDRLTPNQPELDAVLGWLGCEQRLVRKQTEGARAEFVWQKIPNAKGLCELHNREWSNDRSDDLGTAQWQWLDCGKLELVVDANEDAWMTVRQFNDGGWTLRAEEGIQPVHRDASGLFIALPITAGNHRLVLERSKTPLRIGASISLLSFGALCFVSYRRSRKRLNVSDGS